MKIIGYLTYIIALVIMMVVTNCWNYSNDSLTYILFIPMLLAYMGGCLAGKGD